MTTYPASFSLVRMGEGYNYYRLCGDVDNEGYDHSCCGDFRELKFVCIDGDPWVKAVRCDGEEVVFLNLRVVQSWQADRRCL